MNKYDRIGSYKPTIVIASGFFNPIHGGHIEYLEHSRRLGDVLCVIVNNDWQVKDKKLGIIVPEKDRLKIIASLHCVDLSFLSIDLDNTVNRTITLIHKQYLDNYNFIFANGGDVTSCREQHICDELGIKTVFGVGGYYKSISSSEIIRNAYLSYTKQLDCGDG